MGDDYTLIFLARFGASYGSMARRDAVLAGVQLTIYKNNFDLVAAGCGNVPIT
ncbi:MAG: hypothetical protein ACE5E9_08075 [Nitrospinaceae bacterium]